MSYGADFAAADPANAPLDAPILIGADPAVAVAGLLLLLAAFALGWFFAGRSRRNDGDASGAIWEAIDKAAKEAMKADDHALRGKAAHLADVIDRRLGRTLAFAGDTGLSEAASKLRAALAGQRAEKGNHGDHHDEDGHEHTHDDHHGEEHRPHDHHGAAPTATASTGSVTIVNVIPGAAPAPAAHAHKPHHPPQEMSARQQTEALRLAVAALNEYWRHEGQRTGQMRAALAELSGSSPGSPRLSHG
jgi:hypothetical protein